MENPHNIDDDFLISEALNQRGFDICGSFSHDFPMVFMVIFHSMDLSLQAADFKDRQKVRAEDKSAAFGLRTGAQKKATGGSPKND